GSETLRSGIHDPRVDDRRRLRGGQDGARPAHPGRGAVRKSSRQRTGREALNVAVDDPLGGGIRSRMQSSRTGSPDARSRPADVRDVWIEGGTRLIRVANDDVSSCTDSVFLPCFSCGLAFPSVFLLCFSCGLAFSPVFLLCFSGGLAFPPVILLCFSCGLAL